MASEGLGTPVNSLVIETLNVTNLIVSDTLTTNSFTATSQIETNDTLIKLASNNTDDLFDVGWYAKYVNAGSKYRGNVYDVSAGRFIFFDTSTEPVSTIAGFTYSDLQLKDLYAVNLTGTLATAAQPNVTSLGTLSGLTMGGTLNLSTNNITNGGTITATNLTGTLTTAAQPNVTSLGTLSSLNITGDLAANAFYFTGDPDTYISNPSDTNTFIFTAGAATLFTMASASLTSTVPYLAPNGSLANPAYAFANDTNTGLYYTGVADTMVLVTGGTARLTLGTASIISTLPITIPDGSLGSPGLTFTSESTGLYLSAANTLAFVTAGASNVNINTSRVLTGIPFQGHNATASAPTYSFSGTTTAGMYLSTTNTLGFSTSSTLRLSISTTAVTSTLPFIAPDGSASAPSHSFTNSTGSGLYYTGTANTIALATSGTARLTLNTATVDSALPVRVTGTTNYLLVNTTDRTYRSTSGGATTDQTIQLGSTSVSVGFSYLGLDHAPGNTDMGLNFNMMNSSSQIIRTACIVSNSNSSGASRTAGAETGSINFYVKPSGSAIVEWARIVPNGSANIQMLTTDGSATIPTMGFINDITTGYYRSAASTFAITTAGSLRLSVSSTAVTSTLPFIAPDGSVSAPSYSFTNSTGSGLYYTGVANTIAIATAGTARLTTNTTAHSSTLPFLAANGTAAAPSYSFTNSTGSGLYYTGTANTIALTTNGTARITMNTTAVTMNSTPLTVSQTGAATALTVSNATGAAQVNPPLVVTNSSSTSGARTANFLTANTVNDSGQAGNLGFGKADASRQMAFLLFYPSASAGSERIGFNIHSFGDVVQFNGAGQTLGYNTSMTASAPTYSFLGDTNTGMYASAADTINLSTGGTSRVALTTSTLDSNLPVRITGTTNYLTINTTNQNYRPTNGSADVAQSLQIASNTVSAAFSALGLDYAGGATDMGLNFNILNLSSVYVRGAALVVNSSSGTGASSRTAGAEIGNILLMAKPSGSAAVEAARVFAGSSSAVQFGVGSGTAALPGLCFTNDNDTGFYSFGANQIGVAVNGAAQYLMDSGALSPVPANDNARTCGASGQRWSAVWAVNGTIQTSDQNQKQNIQACSLGLNFIEKLNPVSYVWRPTPITERVLNEETGEYEEKKTEKIHTRKQYGLIAQEVKTVMDELKIATNDAGFYIDTSVNEPDKPTSYGLNYTQFIAPLIKAVQELSAKVKALESRLDSL